MTISTRSAAIISRRARRCVHLGRWLAIVLVVAMVGARATHAAQDATPVPTASSGASAPSCGERLGIGDASVACLTVVQAATDAGSVDIRLDGNGLFSGVAFASATGFVTVPAGGHDLSITAAGQPDSVLVDLSGLETTAGMGVEIAIVGSRTAGTLQALTLPIDSAAPPAGSASLRIVQAVPDAPPVDLGLAGGQTLIPDLAPLSASDYLAVPTAATAVEIRTAGTADALFPIPGVTLPDGATVTVYALGTVTNPTGITLLTVLVPGTPSPGMGTGTPPAATPVA